MVVFFVSTVGLRVAGVLAPEHMDAANAVGLPSLALFVGSIGCGVGWLARVLWRQWRGR